MPQSLNAQEFIVHPSLFRLPFKGKTSIGSAPVIEKVLSQLVKNRVPSNKCQQKLKQVDYYMLEETKEIAARIKKMCSKVGIEQPLDIEIHLENNKVVIRGTNPEYRDLQGMINEDKWLSGAFAWLKPNFIALAHSVELVTFSMMYEQSIELALDTYQHFDHKDNGLNLSFLLSHGEIKTVLESPVNAYWV